MTTEHKLEKNKKEFNICIS